MSLMDYEVAKKKLEQHSRGELSTGFPGDAASVVILAQEAEIANLRFQIQRLNSAIMDDKGAIKNGLIKSILMKLGMVQ